MLKIPRFNDSFVGSEGRRKFLASASRGPGSKPIPRSDDLFEISKSYKALVPQLGFIDSLRGMDMAPIVSSLGDAVNTMVKNYLRSNTLSSILRDLSFKGLRGRNVLHTAAAAGYAPIFSSLEAYYFNFAEQLKGKDASMDGEGKDALRESLFRALTERDERGQTAVDIARIRWGKMSRKQFSSMKNNLYHKNRQKGDLGADISVDDSDLGPVVNAINSLLSQVSTNQENAPLNQGEHTSMYGVFDDTEVHMSSGGWDTSLWRDSQTQANTQASHPERCDVLEVSASFASTGEFSEWFFKNHMVSGVPLVIRQGVSEMARLNFIKENFVKRYLRHVYVSMFSTFI